MLFNKSNQIVKNWTINFPSEQNGNFKNSWEFYLNQSEDLKCNPFKY